MYRVIFTHSAKGQSRQITKFKATAPSAINLVHKVHSSLSHNLVEFAIHTDAGWVEYDMPWVNSHAAVKARILELEEFHELWYEAPN